MAWYDWFSKWYDQSVERLYAPYRPAVAAELGLTPGARALDLACGTGPNLGLLADAVGPSGSVLGVDASAGMLSRARARASAWPQVSLLERDARALTSEELGRLDGVLCTLGLSVIPEWEAVLAHVYGLLAPGAGFVAFDVHARSRVPQSWIVERVAQADLSRKPWEAFERLGAEVTWRWLPGSAHVHGGTPFVVTAVKR